MHTTHTTRTALEIYKFKLDYVNHEVDREIHNYFREEKN